MSFSEEPPNKRMRYLAFDDYTFRYDVDEALRHVKKILDVNRNPRLAEDVDHDYSDKYELANTMTNLGIITQMNCLEKMGLTVEILKGLDKTKEITLRFQSSEKCIFVKENEVEIPSERTVETVEEMESDSPFGADGGDGGGTTKATITRVVKRVKEYVWRVEVCWEVFIYSGVDIDNKIVLQNRQSSSNIVIQSTKEPPIEGGTKFPQFFDVSLTWLLQQIDTDAMVSTFHIDRTATNPKTKTPLRNEQVEDAMDFMHNLKEWAGKVNKYIGSNLEHGIDQKHNPASGVPSEKGPTLFGVLSSSSHDFFPIQPLMEDRQIHIANDGGMETEQEADSNAVQKSILGLGLSCSGAGVSEGGATEIIAASDTTKNVMLSKDDLGKVINEHVRSLEEKSKNLHDTFPAKHLAKVISVAEAEMIFLCDHVRHLCLSYSNSMQYIEKMLERQLIAAIGKRVDSSDLDKFVRFHNGKLLGSAPESFCYSVRRPNHYPDGLLSIEGVNSSDSSDKKQPIDTFVREVEIPGSLKMPLNAAATLELMGKAYLHGWLQHRFEDTSKKYELIARARQFSSFMLVVGTMTGSDELDPKDAIILQNKDEVIIPLLLDEIPSAKEFKDAIKSLSPEQQRFAKSFRGMQLESSVLGVCIIQIKPQLEALLNLPSDALTKEMKLTQDLMELFIEYQVPSDLLSYDGEEKGVSVREKVDVVKGHVSSVVGVIDGEKKKQLEEESKRAQMPVARNTAFDEPESFTMTFTKDDFYSSVRMMAPAAEGMMAAKKSRRSQRSLRPVKQMAAMGRRMSSLATTSFMVDNYSDFGLSGPSTDTAGIASTGVPIKANQSASSNNLSAHADTTSTPDKNQQEDTSDEPQPMDDNTSDTVDFTMIPKTIDSLLEKHDTEGSLRSTIIKTTNTWTRYRQENLLSKIQPKMLSSDDIKSEKNKAFDLLDALSRSGSLPIDSSELHVIICLTHRFEKDVMGTVIEDNINPIEKLEKSTLLFGSAIHGVSAGSLIRNPVELKRLSDSFPLLLPEG